MKKKLKLKNISVDKVNNRINKKFIPKFYVIYY